MARHPALLERFPVGEHIACLDATPREAPFQHIPPEALAIWRDILDEYGPEALELYNRLTMLDLMNAFEERAAGRDYPASIIDQFRLSFSRIENTITKPELGTYPQDNDQFLKDFAICRQTVFPVGGAQIVEGHSGFSRSVILTGGIGQFFKFLFFYLFVVRGNRPFYVTHTQSIPSELKDFTPEGREGVNIRIAEMLERHREIKGWCACSWLLDLALGNVSPRHAYLANRPLENGAWSFRYRENISGGALSKSATRRKLYKEGKYIPTDYLIVWPRKKMIAWARRR